MNSWKTYIENHLESAKDRDQYRFLKTFDAIEPGYLIKNGKRYLNLSANDYLGLAASQPSTQVIKNDKGPAGAGASRLITGNLPSHTELEHTLANWKKTPSALIFPSGYQTNLGLITALAGRGDGLFCDRFNHASIFDGCLLSGAHLYRYKHNDLSELEALLAENKCKKRMIITDGVFSMDGNLADLPGLNRLAQRYDALLIVDEAHATGVLGETGAGSWNHCNLAWQEHVVLMGTLSKAVGAQGGFVCGSEALTNYLINFSRAFIYSTGISPYLATVSLNNINRIQTDANLIDSLHDNTRFFRQTLMDHTIPVPDHPTPIIPIIIGESQKALQMANNLFQSGIVALAFRPPTVPEGTARLRLSISAAHKKEDLKRAAECIAGLTRMDCVV